MSILKKINDYDKKKSNEIKKILNIKNNFNINFDESKLIMYLNNNTNKLIGGNYFFFGIYQPNTKLWIWASSIPGVNKNQILKIKELKNKSYLFENNNNKDIMFIYQLLNNDIILLEDTTKFKLINKVLLFLSDSILILNPINKSGNIQFIALNNIIEKYI